MTLQDLERAAAWLKRLHELGEHLQVEGTDHSPKAIVVRQLRPVAREHLVAVLAWSRRPAEIQALPPVISEALRSEAEMLTLWEEREAVARYMAAINDVHEILEALRTR
ncbi:MULTISPECIES: hypothetical protein [unclassified Rhizobacter]|uniref:hypothetical protein n=1 Tax=unclassified Rhizobacter TaxID=2640088 RepID=UPI0006F49086|nr:MULTISPECIES: hypothetical protein [unclassified Rhizobacter]KQU69124.1 hypothetical protein ASC88_28740 [Rhizobacter sp. Root29]KQW03928.1 hypothetical protein ASC98_26910 [Rhizobacter sp. Root1238]KRB21569.1 hypothetical protein ASE08_21595 [Rhizobacter sp. Root16D2]